MIIRPAAKEGFLPWASDPHPGDTGPVVQKSLNRLSSWYGLPPNGYALARNHVNNYDRELELVMVKGKLHGGSPSRQVLAPIFLR